MKVGLPQIHCDSGIVVPQSGTISPLVGNGNAYQIVAPARWSLPGAGDTSS